MSQFEIQELRRRIALDRKVAELKSYYSAAQKGIKAKLLSIDLTEFQQYKLRKSQVEINAIIRGLNLKSRDWSKDAIGYSYRIGTSTAGNQLKSIAGIARIDFDAPIHKTAVGVLSDATLMDLANANQAMQRNINGYIRRTQQRILEDKEINKMLAKGVITGEAKRTVSDTLQKQFQKRLGAEQFIPIKGRNYRPDSYAELVARTRTNEAVNQAAINTSLDHDNDLMQVSVHANACPDCEVIQGRVYSISGNHPDFPPLDDIELPLHPNCKHYLLPINEFIMRERNEYDSLSRFSKTSKKIDSHRSYREELGALV